MTDKMINEAVEEIITIEFDDGEEMEFEIMGVFEFNNKEYIALIPLDDSDDVYLYEYVEQEDDEFDLLDIEEDVLDSVIEEFDRIMGQDAEESDEE